MLEREHDQRAFGADNTASGSLADDGDLGHMDGMDRDNLCDSLLESFVIMASKSKRRQADLSAALRRSGLKATAEEVRDALRQLEAAGCIREIVPLYDGGMLMTVTNMGMDRTGRNPHWRFLDKLMPQAM